MLVESILIEEKQRLEHLRLILREELDKLPKGSISEKNRGGAKYYYWASRDNDRIVFKYIGREGSESAIKAQEQREKQLDLRDRIKKIQIEIKELENLLHGSRG